MNARQREILVWTIIAIVILSALDHRIFHHSLNQLEMFGWDIVNRFLPFFLIVLVAVFLWTRARR